MRWSTPHISRPLGAQVQVWHQNALEEYPALTTRCRFFSIHLPTTGDGWPKATRHEIACLLSGQNMDCHCHRAPKTLINFQETGGAVTHSLQVLHTLLWPEASKEERTLG